MKKIEIEYLGKKGVDMVEPDFIYNRFDIFCSEYKVYKILDNDKVNYVEAKFINHTAELGIWLTDVSREAMQKLVAYIWKNEKRTRIISYINGTVQMGECAQKNHFSILLPDNVDALDLKLSSKGRYNIRREKRIITNLFNGYIINEWEATKCPEEVFIKYFELKKMTHNIDYNLKPSEYIKKYHVSCVYAMEMEGKVTAILLSCEQCPVVYIENLTYDPEYAKYSLGQLIYDYYLHRLIEKGFGEIFLAGGELDYKKRYGSEEKTVYDGIIYKYQAECNYVRFKTKFKACVKKLLRR